MSAIGLTGAQQTLAQYLQAINANPLAAATGNATTTAAAQIDADDSSTGASSTETQSVSGGHHRGGGSGFFKQVQSAVTSALDAAQSSGSTTDPNTVIEDAIQQVLQQQSGSSDGNAPTSALDGSGETDGANSAATFAQLLQSNGVDPAQFHQDFLSAITAAQSGGTTDPSGIFSGFPTGSAVDELV